MRPELFALFTAVAWGVGGFFEKKGLHEGHLSPEVGITLRTAVALVVLSLVSLPQWKSVGQAGTRALASMIVGGGIVAGSVGMLSFYAAIRGAPLSRVMPIAFTSPLFGALMGYAFGGETVTPRTLLGMALTLGGIVMLTTE